MKHKTAELEGALLNAAVLQALGYAHEDHLPDEAVGTTWDRDGTASRQRWTPSTNWGHGGPVFERHYSQITAQLLRWFGDDWTRKINATVSSDVLVWFMRAYVASKFGDEVELP